MIVPSIDILGGRAVQMRGGRHPVLEVGNPEALAEKLSRAGEIAVVDLDAALGKGSNTEIIRRIIAKHPCRVGGGIRSKELALEYLDLGARAVMIGTKASPEFLADFPAERLIAALDTNKEKIMVGAGRRRPGRTCSPDRRAQALVGGFLVTTIDREGEMNASTSNGRGDSPKLPQAGASPSPGDFGGKEGAAQIAARTPWAPKCRRYGPCDRSLKPSPGFFGPFEFRRRTGFGRPRSATRGVVSWAGLLGPGKSRCAFESGRGVYISVREVLEKG
jgi:hypothetical protein